MNFFSNILHLMMKVRCHFILKQDPALLALPHKEPTKYVIWVLSNYQIICGQTKTGVYMCLIDAML